MAAPLRLARLAKIVTDLSSNCIKRHQHRPPAWLTGYPNRKDPRAWETHPWEEKTLEERMEDMFPVDEELEKANNIGEDYKQPTIDSKEVKETLRANRRSKELEQSARLRKLHVSLEQVRADWLQEHGVTHKHRVARHYGIYDSLFDGAYFMPVVDLRVAYDYDDEYVSPVHRGNTLAPAETASAPEVEFAAEEGSLWTLVLTNPDGHLSDNSAELLHWMVGNIPGGDVSAGETLCEYLQPLPQRGTGPHRLVFVLYRQSERIDFSQHRRQHSANLTERTFKTAEFFAALGERLCPVGLSFFQAEWDESVRHAFHHTLDMAEPAYEYKHEAPYHPPQEMYPRRQPFDRYFDRYRDKKEIAEEVLRKKLEIISPFKEPELDKYPLIHRESKKKPSWLKQKEELMHRRVEQWRDMPARINVGQKS